MQQDSMFHSCMLGSLLWKFLIENGVIRQINGIDILNFIDEILKRF